MSRFIICSFLLLGWLFYEMSGGSDFVTPVAPVVQAEAKDQPIKRELPTVRVTARKDPVAKPAFLAPAVTARDSAPVVPVVKTDTTPGAANLQRVRTSLSQGLSLFPETESGQVLTLASLQQGATSLTTITTAPVATDATITTSTVEPVADIRKVTGTRVNMRDGPGTIYPIITRVSSGHSVEVLSDSGTGWLRLRTLPDQQIGWISASLVSKPTR